MLKMVKRLWTEEEGQGMAEYGLIIALVAVVVVGALTVLGTSLNDKFNSVSDTIKNASSATTTSP
ncbi:MAG: Flp family type IVb pilin [Firmicutes bacterium]|nr:Flp family type IVb pilin [Bacillota bacterium]